MKKLQKITALLLSVVSCASFAACGGGSTSGGGTGKETELVVYNFGGGVGREWLDNAFKRFAESKKDVSYEEGKTGVSMSVTHTTSSPISTIETDGYHIYVEQGADVMTLAKQGKIMDLTDIWTEASSEGTIASKVADDKEVMFMNEGKYYALPHYEIFQGLPYDIEIFERDSLYIAAPNEADATKHTAFGTTIGFTDGLEGSAKKSCGNDGVYGTFDDGLPSSIIEFVVMCDKTSESTTPFVCAGNHCDYTNYFLTGLVAALSGSEAMAANYSFTGEIEIVTGYSKTEYLFDEATSKAFGITAMKPITQKVTVTNDTGYLTRKQVARYYATALMEVITKMGWIHENSTSPSYDHNAVQQMIVNGTLANDKDNKIAMIFEASHWINELKPTNILSEFYNLAGRNAKDSERRFGWMSLPTQFSGSVQPKANGEAPNETVLVGGPTYVLVNNNLSKNPEKNAGVIRACKDFLKFLYTDAELRKFVSTTGVTRYGIDLEYTEEDLAPLNIFERNMIKLIADENVKKITQFNLNPTFLANRGYFGYGLQSTLFRTELVAGTANYDCYWEAFRNQDLGATSEALFAYGQITESDWNSKFKK